METSPQSCRKEMHKYHNLNMIRQRMLSKPAVVLLGPQIECCGQFWAVYIEKDVPKLRKFRRGHEEDQRPGRMKERRIK